MGRVQDMARADAKRILNEMGFDSSITFTRGSDTAILNALGIMHHLTFDTDGLPVNSKHVRVTVCEKSLNDAGFVTRNDKNDVVMKDVLISFFDTTGLEKKYCVAEYWPDESLGTILLILEKYATV